MMRSPILLLSLVACSFPAFAQDTAIPAEDLFPLQPGSTWTYRVSGQQDRFVVKAVRQEMVGSQTCMLLEATLKNKVVATEHLAFTKDGLFRFRSDKANVEPPVCILKIPAIKGAKWKSAYKIGSRSATAAFTSGTSEVTVPAGKFKVITIQAEMSEGNGRGSKTWISYAKGVGIVRQSIEEGKRQSLLLELEKFEKGEK